MNFYLDFTILCTFFAVLIYFSIKKSQEIESINTFAIGRRSFTTGALTSTIAATWVSGSGFFTDLSKSYNDGWYYLLPALGMGGAIMIMARFFIPRMSEFLGETSVASAMGNIYGLRVRQLVAFFAVVGISGSIAIQFKVMGKVLSYFLLHSTVFSELFPFLNSPHTQELFTIALTFLSATLVVLYTFSGGITSVVETDIIQKYVFIICSVTFFFICFFDFIKTPNLEFSNLDPSIYNKFDLIYVLTDFKNPNFIGMLVLLFYFVFPSMNATSFQRVTMALNITQAQKAWQRSAVILTMFTLFISLVSFMIFKQNPNLNPEDVLGFCLKKYSFAGFYGLIMIGVLSMAMSTADSAINISAALLANDTWKADKIDEFKKLYYARWCTLIIGLFAFILSLYPGFLLDIILISNSYYMPVVAMPIILTVLGYRTTSRCFIITVILSAIFVSILYALKYFGPDSIKDQVPQPIFPGMIFNFIVYVSSHYLLEKKKLYTGLKDKGYFELYKYFHSNKIYKLKNLFNNNSLLIVRIFYNMLKDQVEINGNVYNRKKLAKELSDGLYYYDLQIEKLINLRWVYIKGNKIEFLLDKFDEDYS